MITVDLQSSCKRETEMLRIACCDDEELQLEILADTLKKYAKDRLLQLEVFSFQSGEELLEAAKMQPFDVYILDMLMPEMSGMEVAMKLRMMGDESKIVVLSATVEYLSASYDADVFYYLLKPLDREKFAKIMDMVVRTKNNASRLVQITTKAGIIVLKPELILYVAQKGNALQYHLTDGRLAVSNDIGVPFRDAVNLLLADGLFTQTSDNCAVNLAYVDRYDGTRITLRDGTVLEVQASLAKRVSNATDEYRSM